MLGLSLIDFNKMDIDSVAPDQYMAWLDSYPAQIIALTAEIWWSNKMESTLADGKNVEDVEKAVVTTLALLADSVLKDQPPIRRKKIEALVSILFCQIDGISVFRSPNLSTSETHVEP